MLLLLLLLHHILRCGHHVAAALTAQHLFELRLVLAIRHLVALSEIDATAVRKISLRRIIRIRECSRVRLGVECILGRRWRRCVDLLKRHQIMLSVHVWHLRHALKLDIARLLLQLELALLVAHFVRVLSSCASGTLATS